MMVAMVAAGRAWWSRALLLAVLVSAGCAGTAPREAAVTPVPIASLESVAGKWAGTAKRVPPSPGDDWVEVTISPGGTFQFAAARTVGAALGSGTLTLADGKLTSRSDRGGTATYQLYQGNGRRVLAVEAVTASGLRYSIQLTPAR
jgi:hypothetical protein